MDKKFPESRKLSKICVPRLFYFAWKSGSLLQNQEGLAALHYHENEVLTTHKSSGIASIGARGRVPPLTAKKNSKIGKKEGKSGKRKIREKNWEKRGKIGKKRPKSGRFFTLTLLTNTAGYATAQIRWAFTVFVPLLMEPWLHQHRAFDFINQFVNCTSKNIYCVIGPTFYTSSKWMDVNPWSWVTTVLLKGHRSNGGVWLLYSVYPQINNFHYCKTIK